MTGLSAADGFAIAMLGMVALSLGVIAVLFLCMRRSAARRDEQVDKLLEEIEAEEKREAAHQTEPPQREPWEKEGDWWKR